ncbi:MAG: hypothetical protein COA54_02305 [Thiotrichaceae bacterium]|nr:MAG: hypothetical protein COA54_02305 [Thiotrichaceae bacterium]
MSDRNAELAKIHIGKKQLDMDQQTYENMLWTQGRVHSSADLDEHGRHKVIKHLENCGAKFIKRKSSISVSGNASHNQISMINALWANLAAGGEIIDPSNAGLRKWLQNATRRQHERGLGWKSPKFLPGRVATKVIEQLKCWCDRTGVKY